MKKSFYTLMFILFALLPGISAAGMVQSLTDTYVSVEPNFGDVEYMEISFIYSDTGDHRAVILYYPIDSSGNRLTASVQRREIYNRSDDPATDPALCTAENVPYNCCTGVYPADPNAGCDEEVTDFSAFTAGFLTTLNSRAKIAVEQDIANEYTVAP